MRIVKPYDWERVATRRLVVIVEDISQPDLVCVIWDKDAFATLSAQERPVLASAPLIEVAPGVGMATFEALEAWRRCVLGIAIDTQAEPLAVSGVILARSDHTDWLGLSQDEASPPALRVSYPLPFASNRLSHVKSATTLTADAPVVGAEQFWTLDDAAPVSTSALDTPVVVDAMSSLRLEECVGLPLPKWLRLQFQSPYVTSAAYVGRFRDAYATLPAGVVISPQSGLWSDSAAAAFFNDPDLVHHPALFRAAGRVGMLVGEADSGDKWRSAASAGQPTPLLLSNSQFRNPAHWLLNSLYAAFLLRERINQGQLIPIVSEVSDYISGSLESIGIGLCRTLVLDAGFYHFDELIFPSTLSGHVNFFPPAGLAPMFTEMRRWSAPWTPADAPRRIYVTRQGSPTQRRIGNEAELISELRERGFSCVAPHELSFKEEVAIFGRAEIIVGQLGAGLVNIGFAPPGCNVVEISSQNYTSNDYWFLGHHLGHKFARILVDDRSGEDFALDDFSFDAPIRETLRSIDRILASP